MQTKLFINGAFIAGEGKQEAILDPATGDTLVTVAEASPEQINHAVEDQVGGPGISYERGYGPRR